MNPKHLTNSELADVLRAMVSTGICPTEDEKAYLLEAAERLDDGGNNAEVL